MQEAQNGNWGGNGLSLTRYSSKTLMGLGITWLKSDHQPLDGTSAKFIFFLTRGEQPGRECETILNPEYPFDRVEMPWCLILFTWVRLYNQASRVLNYMSEVISHSGCEMRSCPFREASMSLVLGISLSQERGSFLVSFILQTYTDPVLDPVQARMTWFLFLKRSKHNNVNNHC